VRRLVSATALGLLAALLVQLSPPAADAALTTNQQPRFERSIGGAGRPGVFAWGVQYNPVTQEVLVGDYLNFKIRRYDKQGNALGDFYRDDHVGQPYSIAVDPNDGAIYVAELKDNPISASIAKYDKFGNFLYDADASLFSGSGNRFQAFYPVWMTVEEDTGDVWVLDSHYQNIGAGGLSEENPPRMVHLHFNDGDQTVTELPSWAITPPGTDGDAKARIYGIDITDNDKIYMTDAYNRRAYIYNRDGTYESTFAQTQTGGDNRSVVVNEATDRVYIVDAEHSDIDMFRMDGSYLSSFGSEGNGPGQFSGGGRQIDIDDDGNLWVGDFGGFETEKYSPTGTPLLRAPLPSRRPPVGMLAQPRDVAIDDSNGDVWVADAWAQRFQRFSSTGASLGAWGERGPGGAFNMNYPRHIAIQPATSTTPKRIWVVQERGHHIQVYNAPTTATGSPTYVRQIGQIGSDDTDNGHFRWPGDVEFYTRPGGQQVAIISDRMASSVKVLDARTFQEIDMNPSTSPDENFIPVTSNGTAVDPATGNIWIGNGTRIRVYNQTGTLVATYGASGTALGQFQDIADLSYCNGQMYIADEKTGKVTVANLDGTFTTRWGQTYGQGPYDFRGPAGIDCDAQGRIYVTDSGNDRIQVYNTNNTRTFEAVLPSTPAVTAPAQSAVLPLNSVTMTGTAADNTAVGNVEVSVQNYTTGLWWNSANASWESAKTYSLASYTANTAPATTVNWRFVFPGVSPQGRYLAEVRTIDHNGNASQPVVRSFAMTGATAPPVPPPPTVDNVRPDATLGFPAPPPAAAANLPLGLVHFTGNATDNVGVSGIKIALKRNSDGRWWTGTGSSGFGTTYTAWDATLATPGGTATGWSWDWTPRAAGAYTITVEARDAAGNVDSSKPNVVFNVTTDAPDTVAPETTITAPSEGATLPTGNVTMAGAASDDKQVSGVRLAITNGSGQYWNGSAWSATAGTVNASVSGAGTPSATWSYVLSGAPAGSYNVSATAVDASNNLDASSATRAFSLAGAPDTTAPNPSVTSPSQVNATVAMPSVDIGGNVTDNTGTTAVRIGIQDTVSKLWWTGSGWGAFTNVPTVLAVPGSASTTWSYTFAPPASGKYGYQVTAVDAAGNVSAKTAWRTVTMQ
ncbi:MAG: Ig-like domain-containing protein, partial [Nocardioides sp.]